MALNGLYCADVPLSNCSLTPSQQTENSNSCTFLAKVVEHNRLVNGSVFGKILLKSN